VVAPALLLHIEISEPVYTTPILKQMITNYYLGLPMWAHKLWIGEFFAPKTPQSKLLGEYASVFNSVEGNTTFYANPKPETIQRWSEETSAHFRFCFKFPKLITHERKLRNVRREVVEFLELLDPIAHQLGPFLVGLPATFDPCSMDALAGFLEILPEDFSYAVEFRHPAFFREAEEDANRFLEDRGVDRVLFHTNTLLAVQTEDPDLIESQRQKPHVPHRTFATGPRPFVRFVGPPHVEDNLPHLDKWADVVAGWIREGREPYVFLHHAPVDYHAPRLATNFHEMLASRISVGEIPDWPIHRQQDQLTLF
jgi:uncharacterized protein YecE (DUF72 family)